MRHWKDFYLYLQVGGAHRLHQESRLSNPAKDFTQPPPAVICGASFRGSDTEAGTTSVHSHRAVHRSPNCSMHSRERLPSGLLKDFRVGGEEAASNRAHLSDDISGSNDSPDGCNLSDKHERTAAALPSVRALTASAGNVPFGSDDEQEASPSVTLAGPGQNRSPRSSGPTEANNSPVGSSEAGHQPPIMEGRERGLSHEIPQTTLGKEETRDARGLSRSRKHSIRPFFCRF